jgi:signal peptidase I
MDGIPPSIAYVTTPSPVRRLFSVLVLTICLLLLIHAYFFEPFQVPTGSMAPALLGHHRSGTCPRCGFMVDVGRTPMDCNGAGGERYYCQATCPNCGSAELHLGRAPETRGDHVLVNKSVYALRPPRRWEVIVFRLFGKTFIKRLVGLGGEEIEIRDGDVYVNGELVRKTFDEAMGMRVLVFDNDCAPEPGGWKDRWEFEPEYTASWSSKQPLTLDGRSSPQKLTYRHFSLDELKCLPITDEYAYNGTNPRAVEAVHDFSVEADIEVAEGRGTLSFALTDGGLDVEVEISVGSLGPVLVRPRPMASISGNDLKNARPMRLLAGNRYHISMALVDRRLSLRVDGQDVFDSLDLPEPTHRAEVQRPMRFTASGVLARLHNVRLYRDIHYAQLGKNAVHGRAARLAIDQTFALGDNSRNSEDSRFWPNQGAVSMANLVGRAFLVHLPSRIGAWQGWGREWRYQFPDWERVRWVR